MHRPTHRGVVGTVALTVLFLICVPGLLVAAQDRNDDPLDGGNESAWLVRDTIHRLTAGHHLPLRSGAPPRVAEYDVQHYDLQLSLDMSAHTIAGETAILVESTSNGLTEVLLHLHLLTVHQIYLGATSLAFSRVGEELTVTLDRAYNTGETFTLIVTYSGSPAHESWGGFWFYFDMAFSIGVGLYTDPPSMGRYWFPCLDEPDDKATFVAHYTVPEGNSVVGNGLLTAVVPDPPNQTVTYTWEETHPTSTYLVAVAAADWRIVPDPVYPDWIYHYVLPGDSTNAVGSFQNVNVMMDAFIDRFGPYQYDKFSFVGVRIGDMEHSTCVAHLRSLINGGTYWDDLLSHELSHHWWGDWVTVGDWRDIWLSEGFATYAEAIYREYTGGMSMYHSYMNTSIMNYYLNSGETFPMYDPLNMWGATSYEKGGAVLHMLRHVVGEATFFEILDSWGATYGWDNAVTTDLVTLASGVAGDDLSWFFDQWVFEGGYPRYEWDWRTSAAEDTVYVYVDQVQTVGPIFNMPVDFRITLASGDTTMTAVVDQASQVVELVVPERPLAVDFDPDRWILCRKEVATTGVASPPASPRNDFALCVAGPNPFAASTSMRLTSGDSQLPVKVSVYDTGGRLVRKLLDGPVAAETVIEWDGHDSSGVTAANGVYFMRAVQGERVLSHRIILLR